MAEISVDATQWPLVFVTLPAEAADEDVRRYLGQLRLLRERRQAYALVIDANRSRGFTAPQRQMQAEYIASGVELSRKYLKALAFVASSAMQRGMLTAVFWLRRPESPYRVFSTRTEAQAWATTMLAPAAAAP